MSDNVYLYAAGDIRGVTTEMVRGSTPQAARAQCVALGVPDEHVETWAVRAEDRPRRSPLYLVDVGARQVALDAQAATEQRLISERDGLARRLSSVGVILADNVAGIVSASEALAKITAIVGAP